MMNSQWTAQDVERFREQQRWRLRHKSHVALPAPRQLADATNNQHDATDRPRKVSLKFRREHELFVAKQCQLEALAPCAGAQAVALRPAFSVAVAPLARARPRAAESPLPHTGVALFNAFDSAASPEAFALARRRQHNNQDEDQDMASDDDRGTHDDDKDAMAGSLWRRRLHLAKRSPKLGRVALWDAADGGNQAVEMVRMPLPFADDDAL